MLHFKTVSFSFKTICKDIHGLWVSFTIRLSQMLFQLSSFKLQVFKGTIFCFARIKCNVQLADLFLAQLSCRLQYTLFLIKICALSVVVVDVVVVVVDFSHFIFFEPKHSWVKGIKVFIQIRNIRSTIRDNVSQLSDVAHGTLVIFFYIKHLKS